jgi:hypothetical protein
MLASAHDPRSVYLVCIVPAVIGIAAVALLKRRASAAAALGHAAPTSH